MKIIPVLSILFLMSACTSKKEVAVQSDFPDSKGCFALFNLRTQKLEKQTGETCNERFVASSTFKVPLAVMAFDSKVLKDEKQTLKWDGQKRWLDAWNKDHNAKTWMENSVVWFSQELTPKMGAKKFQKYVNDFNYGNKDTSGGLTTAWLNGPSSGKPALTISPLEQIEFMNKLWTDNLPVSSRAMKLTREIMYLETSPKGYKLSGKTGSNFQDEAKKFQIGWFIAHISNGTDEYVAVTNISDVKPYEGKSFGGWRAKDLTKKFLEKEGLW